MSRLEQAQNPTEDNEDDEEAKAEASKYTRVSPRFSNLSLCFVDCREEGLPRQNERPLPRRIQCSSLAQAEATS